MVVPLSLASEFLIFVQRENFPMKNIYLIAIAAVMATTGCRKKDDPVQPAQPGALHVTFQNMAGNQQLVLNTAWYINEAGDSLQLSKYKYYISNIRLTNTNGEVFTEPESYHLIDQSEPSSLAFDIANVPNGSYSSITFMIGVDSLRNVSGAQTGALSPDLNMFWDWNTGYIMAKMEGTSPQSSHPDKRITYHTGGFSGTNNVLKTVTLNFPSNAVVNGSTKPNVHIKSDALEWFKSPTTFSVATLPTAMTPGKDLTSIANNYADMFTVDHVD